jgi:hypothetical protein
MNRWYFRALAGLVAAGLIVVTVMILLPKPPIPGIIKSQLTSTLVLPSAKQATIDRNSAKYDSSLKVLSFNATVAGHKVVMAEQPTPDQFIDIPQAYDKVVENMNAYAQFDSALGTVHLTKPTQLHGGQTAVINAKGTLLFAKPSSNLTDDQWRRFFNSFAVAQ